MGAAFPAIHFLNSARDACLRGEMDIGEALLTSPLMHGDPRAMFNMGWHHCRHGRLFRGIESLSVGRWGNVFGSPPLQSGKPIWHGEPLKGKILLFRGEGGFGDQFANLRFAQDFKRRGAKVIVSCEASMLGLLRTLPYVDTLVTNNCAQGVDHDYWVPAMSAPVVLGYEYENISGRPYIPKPKSAGLPGQSKIGLRWYGNPRFEDHQHRRFPPELMLDLASIPGKTYYSLQRDEGWMPNLQGITDLAPFMNSWLSTAQIIADMDLVITSCTSIAHLSAAMGIPTWVVVPILPYYTWALPGDRSPWYDSVRLFRQERYGDWEAPFDAIRKKLTTVSSVTSNKRLAA